MPDREVIYACPLSCTPTPCLTSQARGFLLERFPRTSVLFLTLGVPKHFLKDMFACSLPTFLPFPNSSPYSPRIHSHTSQ